MHISFSFDGMRVSTLNVSVSLSHCWTLFLLKDFEPRPLTSPAPPPHLPHTHCLVLCLAVSVCHACPLGHPQPQVSADTVSFGVCHRGLWVSRRTRRSGLLGRQLVPGGGWLGVWVGVWVGAFRTSPPHLSRTPAPPPTHTLPCPLPSCVCVPRLSPGTPTTTADTDSSWKDKKTRSVRLSVCPSVRGQISNLAPSPLPHPRPTSHTHTALSFA
ncbi:hypothetical protein MG293_020891 [Ovis ammon polii]|uniref:Uncharacterized protein n=1 Tax=Ovis ammon polii TaxID=230172 RepID=A0AAD4TJ04_OVIAM|nr:hypothetical protein MG293_020891 [Ovis ammon polii]